MSEPAEYSLETARAAAGRDALDDWVAGFLASPGSDNPELGDELTARLGWWIGPVPVPIDQLHRLAGPPDSPSLVAVDEEWWDDRVDEMEECVDDGWEPPPVVVSIRDGQMILEDGNHRVESLRRNGEPDAWAIIGFESAEQRAAFDLPRSVGR